jgi:hypothetical protein
MTTSCFGFRGSAYSAAAVPAAAATLTVVASFRGTRVTVHHVGPHRICPGAAQTADLRTRAGSRGRTASVHNAHSRGAVTP